MFDWYELSLCVSTGGADSSGIDRVGADDKCYDWSSIFLTARTRQCYLGEYSDEVNNETNEAQSDDNLDPVNLDEQWDVAVSEYDFFTEMDEAIIRLLYQ